MPRKRTTSVPDKAILEALRRAAQSRQKYAGKPDPSEFLTPQERKDAAPFYFVLREYVHQLKKAREAAGITLAEVSSRSGLAVESLSRLETGAQTNPTWKTLGLYAIAVGREPHIVAQPLNPRGKPPHPVMGQLKFSADPSPLPTKEVVPATGYTKVDSMNSTTPVSAKVKITAM